MSMPTHFTGKQSWNTENSAVHHGHELQSGDRLDTDVHKERWQAFSLNEQHCSEQGKGPGPASNTPADKWLLKSVWRGLRLLPGDEERERRPGSSWWFMYRLWRRSRLLWCWKTRQAIKHSPQDSKHACDVSHIYICILIYNWTMNTTAANLPGNVVLGTQR